MKAMKNISTTGLHNMKYSSTAIGPADDPLRVLYTVIRYRVPVPESSIPLTHVEQFCRRSCRSTRCSLDSSGSEGGRYSMSACAPECRFHHLHCKSGLHCWKHFVSLDHSGDWFQVDFLPGRKASQLPLGHLLRVTVLVVPVLCLYRLW